MRGSKHWLLLSICQTNRQQRHQRSSAALAQSTFFVKSSHTSLTPRSHWRCVRSQEVLTFSRSRKEEEFQWAAWCAVVLHNLMEYNDIFEKVVSAFHRHSPNSPFRNKVKTFKPMEFKSWIASLTARSAADFL